MTGKHGINSREDFLASRAVQDIAIREYHKRVWEKYLRSFHKYEGQEVGGIKLTKSGMISCAHLVGQSTMKNFIKSNGVINKEDGNGTTCAEYLKGFLGYAVDYSTDVHIKKLQTWKFERSGDYYKDLAMVASGNKSTMVDQSDNIGLYRLEEFRLIPSGYYVKRAPYTGEKNPPKHNDWTGTWVGKHGIRSREAFLANTIVQNIAVREIHKIIWETYLRDYQKAEGREVGGIKLTKSGMIACTHFVRGEAVQNFLKSNGVQDAKDDTQTTCSEYMKGFMGYLVDYSTDVHIQELRSPGHSKSMPPAQAPNNSASVWRGT
jgi:hypothetical protein